MGKNDVMMALWEENPRSGKSGMPGRSAGAAVALRDGWAVRRVGNIARHGWMLPNSPDARVNRRVASILAPDPTQGALGASSGHPDWRGRRARRGALCGRVDPAANARVVCVDTTVTARRIATASTRRGSRYPRLDPGVHRDRARAKGFSSHRRSSPEKRARDDTPSSHIASRAPRRSRARELTILAEQNRVGTACAATKGRRCRRPWREIPPGPTSHQICGEIVQLVPM